jgi:hypothetical protein
VRSRARPSTATADSGRAHQLEQQRTHARTRARARVCICLSLASATDCAMSWLCDVGTTEQSEKQKIILSSFCMWLQLEWLPLTSLVCVATHTLAKARD